MHNDMLLTDRYARAVAKSLVVLYLLALLLVPTGAILVSIFEARCDCVEYGSVWDDILDGIKVVLLFPFENVFQSFLPIVASVIPIVLSKVCYQIEFGSPPKLSEKHNRLGRLAMLTFFASLIAGAVAISLFAIFGPTLAQILTTQGLSDVETLIKAQTSFSLMYLLQFMGLKPS